MSAPCSLFVVAQFLLELGLGRVAGDLLFPGRVLGAPLVLLLIREPRRPNVGSNGTVVPGLVLVDVSLGDCRIHRGFFEKMLPNPIVTLDLFDEQDLRAYVGVVHHAFLDAIVDLMVELGQDASKLERSSKGFLGIS